MQETLFSNLRMTLCLNICNLEVNVLPKQGELGEVYDPHLEHDLPDEGPVVVVNSSPLEGENGIV